MVCIKKNRGKEIERKTSLVYNLPSAIFFSLRVALHRIYKTKTNKFWIYRSGNYDNSMYLIIFHSLHLHLYWQGCNTHKKCWNTQWVNELVPWKAQCFYFYRNNNAGATMLISCGTKKTRSIYMANTVSKIETKKENH